jgi:hypothetical protein
MLAWRHRDFAVQSDKNKNMPFFAFVENSKRIF